MRISIYYPYFVQYEKFVNFRFNAMSLVATTALQPEQKRALKYLVEYLENWDSSKISLQIPSLEFIISENNTWTFDGSITSGHLPSEGEWFWNQAHASVSVTIPDNVGHLYPVAFRKLLCRKKRSATTTAKPPRYKLWVFEVTLPSSNLISVVWCERGETSDVIKDLFPDAVVN